MTKTELNNLYKNLKHGEDVLEASNELKLTVEEIYGAVELLKVYGKNIDIVEKNDRFIISKRNSGYRKEIQNAYDYLDYPVTKVGLIGDTHLCTKYARPTLLSDFYKRAQDQGVKTIIHVGDLTDGYYGAHRPEQMYELVARGFDEQTEYVIDYYPKMDGMKTYFIQGNHDFTHERNDGATIGKWISRSRDDMIYLGKDSAMIPKEDVGGVKFMIEHPDDGCGKFYSYALQKNMEALPSGNKPAVYACGHYHKYYYAFYRNVPGFLVPCLCAPSAFVKRKHLASTVGGLILDIYSDDKGHVQGLSCEEILYDEQTVAESENKLVRKIK